MGTGKLDAVLPLTRHDLARSEILRLSLDHFFPDLGTCWVVVPDRDADRIARAVHGVSYRILPESELVPERAIFDRAGALLGRYAALGWVTQQIIKLAIAPRIVSDFYLTLDADVVCVRPVRLEDLVRGGRGRTRRYTDEDIHPGWYRRAAELLRMPRSKFLHHSVTPCLLATDAVLQLQSRLAAQVNPILKTAARLFPGTMVESLASSWRSYLLSHLGWSEYALYHTFLEGTDQWERYHYEDGPTGIAWNSVWHKDDLAGWEPGRCFRGEENFFFTVIQSNTEVAVLEVWEKVRRYIVEADVPAPQGM